MAACGYVLLGAWTLVFLAHQASGQEQDVFEALEVFSSRFSAPEMLKEMQSMDNTSQCVQDMTYLVYSKQNVSIDGFQFPVDTILIVLDSFGKPVSGILHGAFQFRGSYDECLSVQVPEGADFTMQYCSATLLVYDVDTKEEALPFPITEGMCLANSCDRSSVDRLLADINEYLAVNRSLPYSLSVEYFFCTEKGRPPFTAGAIVMIVICCGFVAMALVGTFYHWLWMVSEASGKTHRRADHGIINDSTSDGKFENIIQSEKSPLLAPSAHRAKKTRCWSLLHDLVMCFSLYKTLPAILTTYQPPAAITCINGMRTISMFWVILAHVFFWMLTSQDFANMADLYDKFATRFSAQPILNGFFSVDSFFFLSGLLVCYLTMREMQRRNGRFPYVPYYVHRFFRLTPTYMFVLFFNWYLTMYLSDGPYYQISTGPDSPGWKNCESYWWANLLYINNFYPARFNDQCMGWAWYLANDMQFFIISPLVLIPLYLWLPAGIAGTSLLLAGSFTVTGFIAGYYRIPANMLHALGGGEVAGPDFPDQATEIYGKPYCRISPYLIGIVLGYIIYRGYRPTFHKAIQWCIYGVMWIVAGVLCMSTVYGLYETFREHDFSLSENVAYLMLSRCAWGVGLALVVFACHNGYGGVVNRFLSMPFWVPLSRLTFNAYLVHPIVLTVIFISQRYPFYYTDLNMALLGISAVVLSYGAASVVTLLVEFPIANVEMTFFRFVGLPLRESVRRVDKQS